MTAIVFYQTTTGKFAYGLTTWVPANVLFAYTPNIHDNGCKKNKR